LYCENSKDELEAQYGSGQPFFSKALAATHSSTPGVITVDKHAAYPMAFNSLKTEGIMPDPCALRQSKYFNTLIKRLVKTGMGFFSFEIAL
jgi:transposase, IS6 family